MENLIEGDLRPGQKVVVVEDLISTGGSSLKAVDAIRNDGCEVLGMLAIFTYGFEKSVKAFEEANCKFFTLSNYESLLDKAIENDYAKAEDKAELVKWYKDPEAWGK